MANENEIQNKVDEILLDEYDLGEILFDDSSADDVSFDSIEAELEAEIEQDISDLELLEEDKEKIGNPSTLGDVIKNEIWEQFLNQVAVTAGEDFIKANRGLKLDLRDEAHIQTTENFEKGKIATHNTEIDYQQRYDDWQANFVKDENGNIVTHKTRTGKDEATLVKGARKPFDDKRPSGSAENHTDMDHTVSAAEIIRDPGANAHMTKDEQIDFANSDKNLYEMDSSLNRSKGDKSTSEWLDNPNSSGQKPDEIFDISEEEKAKMRQKDEEAREEFDKRKKEGEERSKAAGKKSQREEAFRIGGAALRAVVMQLLAELVKDIIGKLVAWFKSAEKSLKTLLEHIKVAISKFISNIKQHLVNAGNTLLTVVATAIIGPVVAIIKKAWMVIKQSWASLKEAIAWLKDKKNANKPTSVKIMEVGKIVIAGMSAISAVVLGEVIEKALTTIPVFAIEIPLIGSLANIIGILMGAVVSGVVGAIAINLIDKRLAKKQKSDNVIQQINKGNEILKKQETLINVKKANLDYQKENTIDSVSKRHKTAGEIIRKSAEEILNDEDDHDNTEAFDEMDSEIESIEW